MKTNTPMVSVICITYGHEDYIAQALESFLMQKTDFPFQILVGEDKGPDRTAEIVLEYAAKYPDIIKPFIREKNLGAQGNLIDLCNRAGTKYLAFCEGDDYWTDEYKLQKQFELMEAHPEYRACFHNTMIMADPSWYLYGYYKKDKNGNIYIPESIPNYDNGLREMRMDYYIKFGPAHTSSLFYRWDETREIPEWYYKHIYGDHSLVMIQVGEGTIGYIPETMSVYRRSEVGVLMYDTKTDHFLKSRESWIEMAMDLERYFIEHYNSFAVKEIRERIALEFENYLRYIVTSDNLNMLENAYRRYAYPASLAIKINALNRRKLKKLETDYSQEGLKLLLSDENTQKEVAACVDARISEKKEKKKKGIETRIDSFVKDTIETRDNSVWVFSQEDQKYFGGNVRHLYEYIIAFHPEINAVWLTKNQSLIKMFEAENLPCSLIGSKSCRKIIDKASVAVTNCFVTRAFNIKGFNKDIKIVRLGNGVSLTGSYVEKTDEQKPRIASAGTAEEVISLYPEKYEDIRLTDTNRAFFTENYKDTFLQIATNKTVAESYEKRLGISRDNIFICGSPRTFAVREYVGKDTRDRILVIPGWRDRVAEQEEYIQYLLDNLEDINSYLDREDKYLNIHFTRDYKHSAFQILKDRIEQYIRIDFMGQGKDIYHELDDYDVMITDWNSVMYDFMMHDKPVVILKPDNPSLNNHAKFVFDDNALLPGEVATNWNEALEKCSARIKDRSTDRTMRKRALETVFDMTVNDSDNSERIVSEIKKRIGL